MADQTSTTRKTVADTAKTAATQTAATNRRKAAATKRSTAAKKAATTRKRTAAKANTRTAARAAAPKVEAPRSAVAQAQEVAEKAVLVPVGAALIARERVETVVTELRSSYGTRAAAEKELRRFERRGTTARNRLERDMKRNRTKLERELRQRRTRVERTLKQNRTRVERELKAFRRDVEKQVKTYRKDVGARVELVTSRVENLAQTGLNAGSDLAKQVSERAATLS